jgi:hypothetical protein
MLAAAPARADMFVDVSLVPGETVNFVYSGPADVVYQVYFTAGPVLFDHGAGPEQIVASPYITGMWNMSAIVTNSSGPGSFSTQSVSGQGLPSEFSVTGGLLGYSCYGGPCNDFTVAQITPGMGLEINYNEGMIAVATPLPAALPLFAGGLGALGLLGWRRKRKAAAAA